MSRREPDAPHDPDPLKGGLKHNPFAALKGTSSPPTPAPSSSPAPPAQKPRERAPARGAHPAKSPAPPPSPERVTVRQERAGRGGKTVTIAEGPGLAGRDLGALAREIARGLGAGARVEERAVVVQGDQRERLVAWLAAHGFPSIARGN